jgi:MscS family membrane protein
MKSMQRTDATRGAALAGAARRAPAARWLLAALLVAAAGATRADPVTHPLRPVDLSSPRATLARFLEAGDAMGAFLVAEYLPGQKATSFLRVSQLADDVTRCLDLSHVAPAAQAKEGRAAAMTLYEVLSRIPLPPLEAIPDAEQMAARKDGAAHHWTIPDTEITLSRVESGPRAGQFLFSPGTVARSEEYYRKTRDLPYLRTVPLRDVVPMVTAGGGWMVPYPWIRALPAWLRAPLADQAAWKWIAFALLLAVYAALLALASRWAHSGPGRNPLAGALRRFTLPLVLLLLTPVLAWLALRQVNLVGHVGSFVQIAASTVMFVAGAGMATRMGPVVAEAIITSPRIAPESIDAHLIRLGARLLGILGGLALLALGADRLGIPVYGIVAGFGVGGLAVALAARPTLENLIAGVNLLTDKPIQVGDKCKFGDTNGTVLSIGIRSARILAADRAVTTVPNASLERVSIVNLSKRDRTAFTVTIGLRYETTRDQVRRILDALRAMLVAHPRVVQDGARARLVALGASSIDVEVNAFIDTASAGEFQAHREELLLRIMEIVEQNGAAFAFPSQTLYLGKDALPGSGNGS